MAASSSTLFSYCRAPTVSVQSMCEQELLLGLLDRVQFSQNLGNDMFTVLFMVLPNTLNKELYGVCRYGKLTPHQAIKIPAEKLSELDQTRADPLRITAHIAWVTMTFVHWGGNQSSGRWAVCCPFYKDCWGCWYAATCETSDSQVTPRPSRDRQ